MAQHSLFEEWRSSLRLRWAQIRVTGTDRVRLYGRLATGLAAGARLSKLIAEQKRRREKHGKNDRLYILLSCCEEKLASGKGLHAGFAGFAKPGELMLIRAGMEAGKPHQTLLQAAGLVKALGELWSTITSGLAYPIFLLLILCVVVYVLATDVIPSVLVAVPRESLSPELKNIEAFANFISSFWGTLSLGLFGLFFLMVIYSFSNWTGRYRVWADRIPPWSIYRLAYGLSWLLSMAAMLEAGIPTKMILVGMQKQTKSPWLLERLKKTLRAFSDGGNLGDALVKAGCEFPDREVIDDLIFFTGEVGQASAIQKVAEDWMDHGLKRLKTLMVIFQALFLVMAFGFVGYFVLATLSMGTMVSKIHY